ncbi:MAG: biopolymer transporter ExbD [Anaerolineae bacterium]|nr:biopolymer transporter ExbD [Gloeobacterales cyanobacterium ES-bin-313]
MSIKLSGGDDDSGGGVGEINVVPLIDVLFAILTFFVLASIFLTRQQGLPLDLPKATTAESKQMSQQVTLSVNKEGKYFLNKNYVELKDIGAAVKAQLDADPARLVVVAGDKKVEYRYVISLLDELRKVNATKFALATDSE